MGFRLLLLGSKYLPGWPLHIFQKVNFRAGAPYASQCSSLCDGNDPNCCCDSKSVLATATTIDDSAYTAQGGFYGFWGYNHSAHSVNFVPPVVTTLPTTKTQNYTRTFNYRVCMTANNGEDSDIWVV
jgi:hypothetical protein